MRSILYNPNGRAKEYSNWAVNLSSQCPCMCHYCFNLLTPWANKSAFQGPVSPSPDVLARLEYDLTKRKSIKDVEITHPLAEPILFCFGCDPCPSQKFVDEITQPAIDIIHESGNSVRLLTKLPQNLPGRTLRVGDEFGVTLTCVDSIDSRLWEPHAAAPAGRIDKLRIMHGLGIATWASFEPVIDPEQTLALIKMAAPHLSYCKIGTFNHSEKMAWPSPEWHRRVTSIDYADFVVKAIELCTKLNLPYYIKNDLREYMPEGMVADTMGVRA